MAELPIAGAPGTTQFMFSTVRVETTYSDSVGSGTAFFYQARRPNRDDKHVLVTNRHVVEAAEKGRIVFHASADGRAKDFSDLRKIEATFDKFSFLWTPHPNEDVDLCAVSVNTLKQKSSIDLSEVFYTCMRDDGIPTKQEMDRFSTVMQVAMIGYPNGLWDEEHNLPIYRRGTTATHPKIDFQGRREVVVDMACFPGSSGSPIIFDDRQFFASAYRFLGVLYAGPQITAEGEVYLAPIPCRDKYISKTNFMMHLGYLIKAEEIDHVARCAT